MTRARHIGLASMSVSDEVMQAALGFEQPFTRRDLERRTGRVVVTWLNAQVRQGNLIRRRPFNATDVDTYEWDNG